MRCPACQQVVPMLVEGTDVCMGCDAIIDPPGFNLIPIRHALMVRHGETLPRRHVPLTDEQKERKARRARELRAEKAAS